MSHDNLVAMLPDGIYSLYMALIPAANFGDFKLYFTPIYVYNLALNNAPLTLHFTGYNSTGQYECAIEARSVMCSSA